MNSMLTTKSNINRPLPVGADDILEFFHLSDQLTILVELWNTVSPGVRNNLLCIHSFFEL